MTRQSAHEGGKVVSPMHRPSLPPGRIKALKNFSDSIGNRTRDLPVCSAVPQPTAPPRTPKKKVDVKVGTLGHVGLEGKHRLRVILSLFSALERDGWLTPYNFRFTSGNDPVTIKQEVGWAPELVWTGAENLAPTRIRSPDHRVRSE
jgi:hypothetical protein